MRRSNLFAKIQNRVARFYHTQMVGRIEIDSKEVSDGVEFFANSFF